MNVRMIHKSGKISGRYDYRRGFIATPNSRLHHSFVRMYEVRNRWWHRFLFNKQIRLIAPIKEIDPAHAFKKDAEIIDYIAARAKYNVDVNSWVYMNGEDNEFQKWIEMRFQSKRDAMMVKLAWNF